MNIESAIDSLCGNNHDPSLRQFARQCLEYRESEVQQLKAQLEALQEDHAWSISPGMAQAKIDELTRHLEAAQTEKATMRSALYEIGRRAMESKATGEHLNVEWVLDSIEPILYPARTPERFA